MSRQNTPEWHAIRAGSVTASNFGKVMTKPRGNDTITKGAETYLYELVGQRLTGRHGDPEEGGAVSTEWGHEQEPVARANYQFQTGYKVAEYGFFLHPDHEWVGGSPDAVIVDEPGFLEIKCPWTSREHVRNLVAKGPDKKYIPQVQGLMWIMDREWCDFVTYDPRMDDRELRMGVFRIDRDEEYITQLSEKVLEFAALTTKTLEEIKSDNNIKLHNRAEGEKPLAVEQGVNDRSYRDEGGQVWF